MLRLMINTLLYKSKSNGNTAILSFGIFSIHDHQSHLSRKLH